MLWWAAVLTYIDVIHPGGGVLGMGSWRWWVMYSQLETSEAFLPPSSDWIWSHVSMSIYDQPYDQPISIWMPVFYVFLCNTTSCFFFAASVKRPWAQYLRKGHYTNINYYYYYYYYYHYYHHCLLKYSPKCHRLANTKHVHTSVNISTFNSLLWYLSSKAPALRWRWWQSGNPRRKYLFDHWKVKQ